ncbi:MAG: hypothetical protein R3F59_35070 [Myxococcota bacterium]
MLEPVHKAIYDEGAALEADGRYGAAAVRYRIVADNNPTWHRARLDQGRVLELADQPAAALAAYAELPSDADAVEATGRLLAALGRDDEAAESFRRLRDLRPEWPGSRVLEAQARAASAPDLAAGLLEDYLTFDDVHLEDGVVPATAATATALRDRGDHQAALQLLGDVQARLGETPALHELTTALEVDAQARALADARDLPLDRDQVARLQGAREAFAAGRVDAARDTLRALLDEQPLSAVTWATLADVLEAAGDVAGADQAIRAAVRLDPVNAAYPAKLGDVLYRWYSGRFDAEAAAAYARAAQRRPDDASLWYRKALAEQRSGAWAQATASFQRAAELDPTDPRAEDARIAAAGAERERLQPVLFAPQPRPDDLPEAAWWAFHRAWAWTQRSEPDADDHALAELSRATALAPGFVRAIELEAAIRARARRGLDTAIARYEQSLALEPDRGWVYGTLARLQQRAGASTRPPRCGEGGAARRSRRAVAARRRAGRGPPLERGAAHARRVLRRDRRRPGYDAALALDARLAQRIRLARPGLAGGRSGSCRCRC